ncbi:BapA/Bap/LapF family large adhesin [Pseudocitrobacter vendiensis]|uniref:VCBS repeat-containing protein n=1 Tax=Pseudocitrobacter vendiensis TaxID=2488306 RepID=A0ABN8TH52_9ENTR|nr:BapA/Bap/LapF family large adhesin [Pseudocitrobacter vendiensis]CAH6661816.1 VCBS repeat-containing protein [Pseudocitrobacter vendiensis]
MRSVSIISKMTTVATTAETDSVTLTAPSIVKIKVDRADIASMQRTNQDLVITLKDGETVTVKNFYVTSDLGQSQLVLEDANGALWWVQDTDGAFHFQQISSIDELLVAGESGNESGGAAWAWILGGAAAAAGIGIAASNSNGSGSHHHDDGGNGGTDPGNPQPPVDTTPPDAPTNLAISPDGKTVTGNAEPGSTIIIRDPNGNIIGTGKTGDDGKFTVGLDKPQSNGEHLTVEAKDPSNNTGPSTPITAPDTTPPNAPTDVAVSNDGKTVTGNAEPGSTVTIRDPNGNVIGTGTAGSDGKFTVDLNKPQTNGEHLTAEAKDPAGNTSPTTSVTAHDTTAPGAPSDLNINAEGTTLTGKAEAGSTVKITDSEGNVLGTGKADSNGNFTITLTSPQTDGERLSVTATDAAGNQSSPSNITAPNVIEEPVNLLRSVVDDVGSITGALTSGQSTDDSRPTFSGRGTAGTTINIFDNGVKIGSVQVGSDGNWSYTPTTPLKDGNHSIVATGASAPDSAVTGFGFTVDTIKPAAPTDLVTAADGASISGKAEAGSTVVIKDADGTIIGTGTAGSNGSFTIKLSPAQITGEQLSATAADKAGNVSDPATALSPDKTAPNAPAIAEVLDDHPTITGKITSGQSTDDTTPTFRGSAEPNSTITIYGNNTVLGTVKADESGNWSFTPSTPLTDGNWVINTTAKDAAGNISGKSPDFILKVDTTPPDAPTYSSVTGNDVNVANGGITNDSTPTISGRAEAGSTVTLWATLNGERIELGTVKADAQGNWTLTVSTPLTDGVYTLTATATDSAGNVSLEAGQQTFTVDLSAPDAPTGLIISEDGSTVTGSAEANSTVTIKDANGNILGSDTADGDGNFSITLTPVQDNNQILSVTATDSAGNTSPPSGIQAPDLIAPDAPDNLLVSEDGTKVTGTAEPGSTVAITDAGGNPLGNATAGSDGKFEVVLTTPQKNGEQLTAIATDNAGNDSDSATVDAPDITAPSIPVFGNVIDDVPEGEGALTSGNTTNDPRPTFSGETEANATITIYDNGVKIGEAVADDQGVWTFTPESDLSPGSHTFTLTSTDESGNTSDKSDAFNIIVDTAAPTLPVITHLTDDQDPSTGFVNNGQSTNDDLPQINGTGAVGSTISVFEGDNLLGTAVVDTNGTWTLQLTEPLGEGPHNLTLSAENAAGNTIANDTPFTFTVDTEAPDAPSIILVTDDVGTYQGVLNSGDTTDDRRPTFSGTAEPNTQVKIYDGQTLLGTATVGSNGEWSLTPTLPLAEGEHDLRFVTVDGAGNVGVETPFNLTVDTSASVTPAITSIADDFGLYKGDLANNQVTDDTRPTLNGTGPEGATITLYDNGEEIGTATVEGGVWNFTPETALEGGEHIFTVTSTNAAGNVSPASPPFTINIDVDAPTKPVIGEVTDNVDEYTGPLASGDETNDPQSTFSGTGNEGDTITLYNGNTVLGTTVVGEDGRWSLTPDDALTEGTYQLHVTATDPAGNVSDPSDEFEIRVDLSAPADPVLVSVEDNTNTTTVPLDSGDRTVDSTPLLTGTADGNTLITILVDGVAVGTTTSDVNGDWTFTPPTALTDGPHTITLTATDAAGNTTQPVGNFTLTVDTTGPDLPVIDSITDDVGSINNELKGGGLTDDNRPTFTGTAEANGVVIIFANGVEIGRADVNGTGQWTFTPDVDNALEDGDNVITFQAVDDLGNVGPESDGITLRVDTDAPDAPTNIQLGNDGETITGQAEPNSTVTIRDADGNVIGTADTTGLGYFQTTLSPVPASGSLISVTAQDEAGNNSPPAQISVVPPTEPAVPIIINIEDNVGPQQGSLSSGDSTDDPSPVITGTAAVGSIVYVTIDGQLSDPIETDENGAWTYTPNPPLTEGPHTLSAHAEIGGQFSAESSVINLIVDVTPPAAATITSITDDVGTVTGPIQNGGATDDTQPTLRGTATGSARVDIYNGDDLIGSATVNAQGNWVFTPGTALQPGNYTFTAVAVDAAGNAAAESNTWTVTIDTATPTAPTLDTVLDNVGTVTGELNNNDRTDDTLPTLSGTAATGSVIIIYDNNVEIGRTTAVSGAWSFTPTTPLGEGNHSLTLTATNGAGNTSAPSAPFVLVVDTVAPNRPVLTGVTDDEGPVTGPLLNNQATNDTQPTFSGTAEAGSTVTIFDNGVEVDTVLVPPSGNWTWTPTDPLSEGPHAITLTTTDVAGNSSTATAPFTVVVDTAAPDAPSAITAQDSVAPTTGAITEGQQTNENRPALSGTVEPNATVQILDNGNVIGSVKANASGNWTFTPTADLADGNHQLTVTATDSAGNVSAPSPALNFVVDTAGPAAPIIVNATDNVGSITAPLVSGNTTDDNTPTLNGTTEAFASVAVLDNGVQIGTAIADENGNWSFTPQTALGNGSHAFTTIATDPAGNVGVTSPAFTLIVDTAPPAAPVIIQAADNVGTVQSPLLTNQSTDDTTPTLSGTGEAGATITIRDNGNIIGTAVVGSNNSWTFTPNPALAEGSHIFTATATDAAGNTGPASGNFVLNVDLTPPAAPAITAAADDVGTVTGPLTNGQVTDDARPTLSGTGEAGATITVYDNGTLLGTTTVGTGGTWTFTPPRDLTTGSHDLTATATDPAGNTGAVSGAWNVKVDTTAPNAPVISTVTDNQGSVTGTVGIGQPTDDTTPTLTGTAEANSTISIFDNGVVIGTAQADGAGNWSFTTPTLTEGAHTITARATDVAGNTSAASTVTTVNVDLTPPAAPTDLVVNATGTQVTGHAEAGSTVTILSSTGTVLGTGVADGLGNFTAILTPSQTSGQTLQAYATDVAGNPGQPANVTAPFTGLPATPVITTIYDDVGTIQGNVGNNQSTNDSRPDISGTAQARATVNIYNNGVLLATVVANDAGVWSYTPTTPLTEGLHAITATATNPNGTSSPSTAINITVDTLAPGAPTATVSADGFTVSGTAEANSTVSVTVPGQATPLTVTTDANGNWTLGLPTRLINGEQVSAIATDAAGNSSTQGLATAPTLPVAASDNVVNLELNTTATVTSEEHSDYGFLLVGALGNVASVLGDDTAQVTFNIDAGGSGSAVIEAAATGAVLSLLNSLEIAVQKYDTNLQAWVTVIDTSLPQFANLLTLGASGVRLALDNLDGGQYRVISFNTSLLAVGSYTSLDVSLVKTSAGTVTAGATENGNVITDVDPNNGGDVAPAGTQVTSITNANNVTTVVGAGGADIAGKYGTLHINQDGSYTYTLTNNSVSVVGRSESFVYTITQGANSSSANLVITLGSTVPPSSVTAADDSASLQFDTSVAAINNGPSSTTGFTLVGLNLGNVIDVGLLNNMQNPIIYNVDAGTTRTLSLGASVGGVAVGAVFDLYVYRYNPETGNYEQYRHVPSWLQAALLGGSTAQDLVITLPDGKYLFTLNAVSGLTVATGFTLSVNADHTYSVKSAGASTTGEVLDNDAGAANGHVTEVNGVAVAANGTTTINGLYGTLTIDAQGHYTYTLKSGLGADSIKTPDTFVYTVTAANGDTSTASLNVQPTAKPVDAVNDTSSAMVLDTAQYSSVSPAISAGSATIAARTTDASSSATFDVAEGTALKSISVTFAINQLTNINLSVNSWAIYEGSTLIYQGTPIAQGQYTLTNSRTLTLGGLELDAGRYTLVFNAHLSSAALLGSVTVTPTINANVWDLDNFLINNNTHTVTGNIYNGHDSAGAVDQIASAQTVLTVSGNNSTQTLNPTVDSNGAATIQGTYGSLRIAIDGSYTYTLKAGLHPGDITTKETFTYTLNDQKGHSDSATLTINMNPQFTSTSQSDVIHGSAYGDTLIYDLLNNADNRGGNGADRWDNFSLAQGDKIDIGDLLVGWNGQESSLGNYLSVTTSGNNTVISIDRDGTGTAHSSTTLITLENVQTTLNELIEQNHIVT